MIGTSFQKKTLYASITGVFLGLILLGCPFFVSAYDWQKVEWSISSSGVVSLPSSLCNGSPEDNNIGTVFNGDIPFEGSQIRGTQSIYCASLLGDPFNDMDWLNSYGDGKYYMWFFNSNGDFYVQYHKSEGVWGLESAFCSSDNCSACTNSENCQSAGCIYEYNEGFARWECHEEYIAYVYGCGLGQCGCLDQETCETAEPIGTCEWVDRGYGEGCYEVEEAPPEAEWEAPELESCEGLGTVETWLCEIRNFFTGLFMPTQEKVDNLKKTLDNFKAKFPFNYIGAVNSFFTTLKTSLDTEKSIPVKVLGVESNVNFSFWDQTTTIGGTSETFKNILFDFTTAIIIIAFLFWIISFIKRIF